MYRTETTERWWRHLCCSKYNKKIIRVKKKKIFLLQYTQGLRIYKKFRNKFYKRYIESCDAADFDRDKQHKRESEFLNKFFYSQNIADIERKLITNPKSFWHFFNSKRTSSYFSSHMSFESLPSSSVIGVANLFAKYFASNFELSSMIHCHWELRCHWFWLLNGGWEF